MTRTVVCTVRTLHGVLFLSSFFFSFFSVVLYRYFVYVCIAILEAYLRVSRYQVRSLVFIL